MPWLTGWGYRKSHIINQTVGGAINDTVTIHVHYGAGVDAGNDVYLNGNSQLSFGDVRFTASDGETLLESWIDERNYTAGTDCSIIITLTEDISLANVTVYIYYGNAGASQTEDDNPVPDVACQRREHNHYLNPLFTPNYIWNFGVANRVEMVSSPATSMGRGYNFFVIPKDLLHNRYLRYNWSGQTTFVGAINPWIVQVLDGEYDRSSLVDFPDGAPRILKGAGLLYSWVRSAAGGNWGPLTDDQGPLDLSAATFDFVTIFFNLADAWSGITLGMRNFWMEINTGAGGAGNVCTFLFNNAKDNDVEQAGSFNDYGLIRQRTFPEPTHGAWGPEETPPTPVVSAEGPLKCKRMRVTVAGIIVDVVEGLEIELIKEGDPLDFEYDEETGMHSKGGRKARFIIRRAFKTGVQQALLFDLWNSDIPFMLQGEISGLSGSSVILSNCEIYGWVVELGTANTVIAEVARGEAIDWLETYIT